MSSTARPARALAIPRGVWALGFVSLFMDVSSEMIHALLPVFLVTVLGASVTAVGLLEGTAEAIASITKVFSGTISDWLGKRKLLTVLGYGLAALTKPLFALAPTAGWVFAARGVDRIGKGIRGAPRDALIAELTPASIRGAAFGLRQTLDTAGAFAGPLLAIALMAATGGAFRTVFWLAAIPAVVSVVVLMLFVREPERASTQHGAPEFKLGTLLRGLGARFWWLVLVAALFTLARFSEAFLILKVADVGLGVAYVPAVLIVMNVAYALSAYPAGWLSDRFDRWGVFAVGAALLIAADLVLAFGASINAAALGIALWGLHMGFTQGLLAALVADAARAEQRGTAFGVFNLVTGLALLAASVVAGVLWDRGGPELTFLAGAAVTAAAGLVAFALYGAGRIGGHKPRRVDARGCRQRRDESRYCPPLFQLTTSKKPPMFRSVRFYSVSSPWPDSEQTLSERLAAAVFKPCGSYTERSSGFEPPAGSDSGPLARRVAGADLLRLRNQARILPTAAINEALEVRLAEYRERMQEEPGRRTKRKLKEQTRDELLPKALLKSDRTTALYLINENVLAVGTGSESRAERFLELLRSALGKLDVEPLKFERPVEHVLSRVFAGDPPPKFVLGRECRMRDRADAKSSVRWSEIDLTHANVRRCVKDGMELTHLGIEFASALSGVLDANGTIGKLKLLGLDEPADDVIEEPLARLDAELALLGGTLRQLVVGLRQALGD